MTGRGPTRGLCACLIAVLVLVLVGCTGQTNRATSVGTTAATLNGERYCESDVDGRWAWQWRELGSTNWSSGGASQLNCPGGPPPAFSHKPTGLKPDTSYQYRLLVDLKQPCDLRALLHRGPQRPGIDDPGGEPFGRPTGHQNTDRLR